MDLTLSIARELVDAALAKAEELGVVVTVAVVDAGAHIVAKARMDGAQIVSTTMAEDKAWTAAALNMATGELQPLVQPGAPLYGLAGAEGGRLVVFGGGLPLRSGAACAGGVGVAGGSVDDDVAIAQAAVARWEA